MPRLLTLIALLLVPCPVLAQDVPTRVEVTGTRVSLIPPAEFHSADRFPGFAGPNGSSIQVTEMAGPFKEIAAGFSNPELAKKQGMTVLTSQPIALDDGTGAIWIHLRQDYRGDRFLKWIAVWGNSSASVLLIATVPEGKASLSESLFKRSFLTARWRPPPSAGTMIDTAGLPFVVRPAEGFEIIGRVGATITVGLVGTRLPDKSGSPKLYIAASTEPVATSQLASTSAGLLKATTPDLILEKLVRSSRSLTIAGKRAHELIGNAKHRDGYSLAFYLVVIADSVGGHIQAIGYCRLEEESKYVPSFRQMAEGLSFVQR